MEKAGVEVPIRQVPYQVKGRFRFLPPAEVHVIGSYALGTSIKPNVTVDLAVEMPKVCKGGSRIPLGVVRRPSGWGVDANLIPGSASDVRGKLILIGHIFVRGTLYL